jgi:hypothetical protein
MHIGLDMKMVEMSDGLVLLHGNVEVAVGSKMVKDKG